MHPSGKSRLTQLDRQLRRAGRILSAAGVCLALLSTATADAKPKKKPEAATPEIDTTPTPDGTPLCFTYANMKDSLAGQMQIPVDAINSGDGQRAFDGYPVVLKLANDRARLCRIEGTLKLADRMMNTYEIEPARKNSACLLLLELTSKTAVLRDRRGACGAAMCGEMKIDGYTMAFDASRRTCMAKPSEKPVQELPPAPPKEAPQSTPPAPKATP